MLARDMHWAGAIVNGWTFSGITTFQSGQPINVEIGYDWNGDGISNDRPILLNKNAPITNWAIKGDDPIFGFGTGSGYSVRRAELVGDCAIDCHRRQLRQTHTGYFVFRFDAEHGWPQCTVR